MRGVIIAVVAGVVALIVSRNSLNLRHWAVLLTFGKFPGLKTYEATCDTTPVYESNRFTKYKHCFDEEGKIFAVDANHNEAVMRETLLKAVKDRCPVLVYKPFNDHKCYERLHEVAVNDKNLQVRVKENIPLLMHNDSWFPTEDWISHGGARKAYHGSLGELLTEYDQGPSIKYTAFDNSLNGDAFQTIWGIDVSFLNGKAGTTFLSNYDKTITTAPYHSAFWDSFGYQCEGYKHWKMLTPEDALPTVRFMTVFTAMKNCDGRKDLEEKSFDVFTPADTMFYFPPYWAHSVQTYPGISVLLNFRSMALKQIFQDNFFTGLTTLTGLIYYRIFYESWDPEEITYFYTTGKIPQVGGQNSRSKDFANVAKESGAKKNFLDKFD
jgi:hypothetical protein